VADADARLTTAMLRRWHRTLMTGSPMPQRYVGRIRDEQGWIGGSSPLDAALVTPPAEELPALLADLVAYANRSDIDPVVQAAAAHAQLEIIHPFGDGNGRVGRVLVSWLLTRRLDLLTPPPVSLGLAADRSSYLAGLTLFRLGQADRWVRWFADVVAGAGRAQATLVEEVGRLRAQWRRTLAVHDSGRARRSDSTAYAVLDLMPRRLLLTARLVAADLGVSDRAAAHALAELAAARVLVEVPPPGAPARGRPSRVYVSRELLGLVGSSVTA
jgi:Fic family protein